MIITLAVRALQAVFALVVLILSIVLIKNFGPAAAGLPLGKIPSLISYGAFCGAAALLISIVGIASCFFDFLQGIVMLALDGFAAFFVVAGGIAFAVKVGVGSCDDWSAEHPEAPHYVNRHDIFSPSDNKAIFDLGDSPLEILQKGLTEYSYRCKIFQPETAIMWLLFGTFVATIALTFMSRSGKHGGSIV